jgi:hypothetical protein
MEELNVLKQVIQIAFSSGKLTNLDEIKVILVAIEKLETKLQAPALESKKLEASK